MALLLWASIFDPKGTPIPFLGLEAAAAETLTAADSLLEDARRMISVDAYRLATIVDGYASCAKGLRMCLLRDGEPYSLQFRLRKMREELEKSLKDLQNVIDRRNNRAAISGWRDGSSEMDSAIPRYLSVMQKWVTQVMKEL